MTLHALVRNGQLVEVRDVDPETVPQHKFDTDGGLMLRPYYDEGLPDFTPAVENVIVETVITTESVTKTYTVERKPIEEQKEAVKAEARRRILVTFPEWKQANMTARAVELQNLYRLNGSWSPQEQAEQDALQGAWDWIKAVRQFSNTIELMDPIPADFNDDEYWTAG